MTAHCALYVVYVDILCACSLIGYCMWLRCCHHCTGMLDSLVGFAAGIWQILISHDRHKLLTWLGHVANRALLCRAHPSNMVGFLHVRSWVCGLCVVSHCEFVVLCDRQIDCVVVYAHADYNLCVVVNAFSCVFII